MKFSRALLLFLLVFSACAPGISATPIETATPPEVRAGETPSATLIPPTATFTLTPTPRPLASRVLIISFDGLRPEAIGKAPMKNLIALMRSSAYSLRAQTILPSATLPAHSSMLSGLCPSQHAVYWNDYVPENGYALGMDLFDLAHASGLRTVMIVGKEKLRQVTEPESTDVFFYKKEDGVLADQAAAEIRRGFGVMFVHFPIADEQGHEWGWMGSAQMWGLRRGDALLERILPVLDETGLRADTLIIVTADHGGIGKSHGGDTTEETTIPWIISGPGVIPIPLITPIFTTDTAATAAWMLGLPLPTEWDGVPVYEAFGQPVPPRVIPPCEETR